MAKKGNVIVGGTIEADKIKEAHSQIREIVSKYKDVNYEVSMISQKIRENWVGDGRNEFETQYNLLIRKVDDFGDTLLEIYEALVQAEADYSTTDDGLRQNFVMAQQE